MTDTTQYIYSYINDTPDKIATMSGLTMERLKELNPNVDFSGSTIKPGIAIKVKPVVEPVPPIPQVLFSSNNVTMSGGIIPTESELTVEPSYVPQIAPTDPDSIQAPDPDSTEAPVPDSTEAPVQTQN